MPTAIDEVRAAKLAAQRRRASFTFRGVPKPGPFDPPTQYELAILHGLQGRPMFAGLDYHSATKAVGTRTARRARRLRDKAARKANR